MQKYSWNKLMKVNIDDSFILYDSSTLTWGIIGDKFGKLIKYFYSKYNFNMLTIEMTTLNYKSIIFQLNMLFFRLILLRCILLFIQDYSLPKMLSWCGYELLRLSGLKTYDPTYQRGIQYVCWLYCLFIPYDFLYFMYI